MSKRKAVSIINYIFIIAPKNAEVKHPDHKSIKILKNLFNVLCPVFVKELLIFYVLDK